MGDVTNKSYKVLTTVQITQCYNLDAEKAILGTIFLFPSKIDDVLERLRPDDFYFQQNEQIIILLNRLIAEKKGLDLTTIVTELKKEKKLEDVGGENYIAELMTASFSAVHLKYYCNVVAECSARRRLIAVAEEICENASDPSKEIKNIIAFAENKIFSIGENKKNLISLATAINEVFHSIDEITSGERGGIDTGFTELDDILGGLREGELVVVAARPGMGKTAFACNISDYIASYINKKILFVSLEMSSEELATRIVCSHSGTPMENVRTNVTDEGARGFIAAGNSLIASNCPITIDSSGERTMGEIMSICRREKRKDNLDLLVVDYIGLIKPDDPKQPRQEQVAGFARSLKLLAKELKIPVVCCAQLNRNNEQGKDNRPKLSHLRESGAIEQDADVVLLLHREEYYLTREEAEERDLQGKAEIIVAKHRSGRTGSAYLLWNGPTCQFANIEYSTSMSEYSVFDYEQNEQI